MHACSDMEKHISVTSCLNHHDHSGSNRCVAFCVSIVCSNPRESPWLLAMELTAAQGVPAVAESDDCALGLREAVDCGGPGYGDPPLLRQGRHREWRSVEPEDSHQDREGRGVRDTAKFWKTPPRQTQQPRTTRRVVSSQLGSGRHLLLRSLPLTWVVVISLKFSLMLDAGCSRCVVIGILICNNCIGS